MNQDKKPSTSPESDPPLQGEGNYAAARRYDEAQRRFVESGQVPEAARNAEPATPQQAEELRQAEQEGRSHSKGEGGNMSKEPERKTP